MAHIIKYEVLPFDGDHELSSDGQAIYDAYVADGRVTYHKEEVGDKVYGYLRFPDEATGDAYVAELNAIDENSASGHNRANLTRYNEE